MKALKQKVRSHVPSLTKTLLLIVVGFTLISSLLIGGFAVRTVYRSKIIDTWALMYLNTERHTTVAGRSIASQADRLTAGNPDLEFSVDGQKLTLKSGLFEGSLTMDQLGVSKPFFKPKHNIVMLDGKSYLARFRMGSSDPQRGSLSLWLIDAAGLIRIPSSNPSGSLPEQNVAYALTREGKLVYANASDLNSQSASERPLVQYFIKNPVSSAQLEFSRAEQKIYGFYQEVPDTNLVLFVESDFAAALRPVWDVFYRIVALSICVVLLLTAILFLPLRNVTKPLKDLIRYCSEIADGKFDISVSSSGYGEIRTLSDAFSRMSKGLSLRDSRIQNLLVEQREKIKLEAELAVASGIQTNLLPEKKVPKESGYDVAATYIPAAQCAGDWYSHYFDESTGETIVAIADVSGHGVGASMFTAVLTTVFEQTRAKSGGSFNLEKFARDTNFAILQVGRGKWHVTAQVLKLRSSENKLEILSCGHTAPVLRSVDQKIAPKFLAVPGEPLGLFENYTARIYERPFAQGDLLTLYTDGITEAKGHNGKMFGKRNLRNAIEKFERGSSQSLNVLLGDWREFLGTQMNDDDACVVVVKAVA